MRLSKRVTCGLWLALLLCAVAGCRTGRSAARPPTTQPQPRSEASDALAVDQAGNVAAEDAGALNLRTPEPERSRRPRAIRGRRAVDQPRIRR